MQSYRSARPCVPSFTNRISRAYRAVALGAFGALALGSMIQPAHAVLDLTKYKLSWEGVNGYSMTGTLSAPSHLTGAINESQIWDMSVSFFDPEHQHMGTMTQVEGGIIVHEGLHFTFDPSELWVSHATINLGSWNWQNPEAFVLWAWEGEALTFSWPLEDYDFDHGGRVTIALDGPSQPENTAPTLIIPTSPLIVEASQPGGAHVYFNVSASDLEDEAAPVANANPESGSYFGLGESIVQVSAQDSGGLTAKGNFTVIVQDTTAPHIYLGTNQCSTDLTIALGSEFSDPGYSAYDIVDGWVSVTVTGAVDTNTVGNYALTYTAGDQRGNTRTITRNVAVVDAMSNVNNRQYSGGNAFGHADFKVSPIGNVTAVLSVNGQNYRSAFTLSEQNQALTFRGLKNATIPANVFVATNGGGEPMLIVSTEGTTLELKPARYSSKQLAPAQVAGTYTAVFRGNDWEMESLAEGSISQRAPMGVGFATITVARDGRVRLAGRTAEGAALSASSHLVRPLCENQGSELYALASESESTSESSEASQFHIYSGLYRIAARGNLSAQFTLDRSNPAGSISGEFHWEAPEGALPLYPAGFDVWGPVVGSRYEKSLPGTIDLRFDFEDQGSIRGSGNVAVWPVIFDVTSADEGRPLGLRCRFNDRTGEFSGAGYRGSAARSFKAIWLQEQGTVQGFSVKGDGRSHGYVEKEEVIIEEPPVIFPPIIFPPIIPFPL